MRRVFWLTAALWFGTVTLSGCGAGATGDEDDDDARETGTASDSGGSGDGVGSGDDDDGGDTAGGDGNGDGGGGGDDGSGNGGGGDDGAGNGGGGDDGGTTPDGAPPLGATSGGSGGSDHPSSTSLSSGGSAYELLAPGGASSAGGVCLLMVYSGTEGASLMMSNMVQVAPYFNLGDCLVAVLDGTSASAADGAVVLDAVRAAYDVDNDRTWLLSESAGTREGLVLGLDTRQSWFAAYWANDVNTAGTPARSASQLGFAPWGNAGPGGDLPDATAIVDAMRAAGYQLPSDAPYSGAGSTTHGSTDQFLAAVSFFSDKRRQ